MSVSLKILANFHKEINNMLNQIVKIELNDQTKYYVGELTGYDPSSGAISLSDANNEKKEKYSKLLLHGSTWSKIYTIQQAFPMRDLADKISKNFPAGQVKYDQDSNTIQILNGKIIVSEAGIEGEGPTAARVKKMYDEFMEGRKIK